MAKYVDPSARVRPSPIGGVMLATLGFGSLASAIVPATRIGGTVAGFPGPTAQVAVGAGFLVIGCAWAAWATTRPPPPKAPVAAHVAFASRVRHDEEIRASNDWTRPVGIAVPAEAPAVESVGEVEKLDLAIRETQQKISKAKVMLGTGKLSGQGYQKYIEELKAELAELEAQRMRVELAEGRDATG